jgi:hypothetical protein
MTSNNTIDAARVELLLSELRLPAIKLMWVALAARADKEGWPAARFLAALAEPWSAPYRAASCQRERARLSTPSTQCRAHNQQGAGDGAPWHTASIFGNAALRSLSELSRHGPKANPG